MQTITTNNNELQVKENWNKPEINLVDVKQETLGGTGNAATDLDHTTS